MEIKGSERLKNFFGAILFISVIGLSGQQARADGPRVKLNIPAGDADTRLQEFIDQSHVEVLYRGPLLRNHKTQAVVGEYEASEALALMFKGIDIVIEFDPNNQFLAYLVDPKTSQKKVTTAATEPKLVPASLPGVMDSIEDGELVVTGTYIRGVLDVISPLQIVTREEMKQTANASVPQSVQTLTTNYGGAQSEDFGGVGNFGRGTALNLRGLGSGATLVLINGRRQPQAGIQADFVDVSSIPWSAVERIEVLPDGTSALYGSDAIAGVVNVIMRNDLEGAESQFRVGTAPNGATETMAAQLFGKKWESGHWLGAYQYSKRTALAAADRTFSANSDKGPLGGSNFGNIRSNPGNILNPSTLAPAFAIPSGQNGISLSLGELLPGLVNYQNKLKTSQLLPDKKTNSIFLTGSQELTNRLELFGEGRYGRRDSDWQSSADERLLFVPATNPFFVNPFGIALPGVIVAYSFLDDLGPMVGSGSTENYGGVLGIRANFENDWQTTLSTSYGQESLNWKVYNQTDPSGAAINAALADPNPTTAFNPFGEGSNTNPATLDKLRTVRNIDAASEIYTANIIGDGPLVDLPKGTVKLALGAEIREENLARTLIGRDLRYTPQYYDRQILGGFAELSIPLVGNPKNERAIPRLELSLAGRYEQYSDFGNAFNPKIGLQWAPLESLKLRGSWGTSFKAPKLVDLYDTSQNVTALVLFADPRSASKQSLALVRQGNNEDLSQETASTWTAGIDFTPEFISDLMISLTGYDIRYEDQVIQPGGLSPFEILNNEDMWAAAITRNPSQSLVDAICSSPDLFGSTSTQCRNSAPATVIDLRLRNLATTRVTGLDLTIDRAVKTSSGIFNINFNGSYIFNFEQAFTKNSPTTDIVNTYGNPLALRMRGTIGWIQNDRSLPGFGANLTVDRTGSYRNPSSTVIRKVKASTTLDMNLHYYTAEQGNSWDHVELGLNLVNAFDSDPPFVDTEFGYDMVNSEPMGRVISFYFQKNWGRN